MRLAICVGLLISAALAAVERTCDLFCFVESTKNQRLKPELLNDVACSHLVLVHGHLSYSSPYSYRQPGYLEGVDDRGAFLEMGESRGALHLLGLSQSKYPFLANEVEYRKALASLDDALWRNVEGIFFDFTPEAYNNKHFRTFIEELRSTAMRRWSKSITIVVVVTPAMLEGFNIDLAVLAPVVDYVYIRSNEVDTDPLSVRPVDPLRRHWNRPFGRLPIDSIEMAAKKVKAKIPLDRIVIGLSTSAKSFSVQGMPAIGDKATFVNKQSYGMACVEYGTHLDEPSGSYYSYRDGVFTTFNKPNANSLGRKLTFVYDNGFAGIGLETMLDDDVRGTCDHGIPMKMHRFVSEGNILDIPGTVSEQILEHHDLALLRKPLVFLRIGGTTKNYIWRSILSSDLHRARFLGELKNLFDEFDIDGVDLAWSQPGRISMDIVSLASFMNVSRKVLPLSARIIIESDVHEIFSTTRPSLLGVFNYATIQKLKASTFYGDFVLLRTESMVEKDEAQHHSIMWNETSNHPDLTVQSVVNYWLCGGYPASNLAIAITPKFEAWTMRPHRTRTGDRPIGKLHKSETRSDDLAALLDPCRDDITSFDYFDIDLGVPLRYRHRDMVSFENTRSTTLKTTWCSSIGITAIAIINVDDDDSEGACSQQRPFTITRAVEKAQVYQYSRFVSARDCRSSFQLACFYRFPAMKEAYGDAIPLVPTGFPEEGCDQLVLEGFLLTMDGIVYAEKFAVEFFMPYITGKDHDPIFDSMQKFMAIKCELTLAEFSKLVKENRAQIIKHVQTVIQKLELSGVLLDFDEILSPQLRDEVNNLLDDLNENLMNADGCPRLAIRISATSQDLASFFNVQTLNRLLYVHLRMPPPATKEQLLLPIRSFQTSQFGFYCRNANLSTISTFTSYDTMTSSSIAGEWALLENNETLTYKLLYSAKMGIGGVALQVNGDMHDVDCDPWLYPVFTLVRNVIDMGLK